MDWRRECLAVIPCYNEGRAVAAVVKSVKRHLNTVLVVDDASIDATAQQAKIAGALVVSHPNRSGKGAALQTGWGWARENGFRWAITLDGDGQHAAEDIPVFLACAEREHADLVVGNRMDNPREMPWLRRVVNRWMSRKLSQAAGQRLADTQCGFRLMNLACWPQRSLQAGHYEIESEMLLAFAAAGLCIRFVPIQVIYRDERSKISPALDTLRWFRWYRRTRQARSRAE